MFDSANQFVVKILSGGEKQCTVRYPNDGEWCERAQKQKLVRRLLGRSKSQYEALDGEAVDAELLARIRLDEDGAPFDEAEAAKVIARLERVSVVAVERVGNKYRIELAVPGGRPACASWPAASSGVRNCAAARASATTILPSMPRIARPACWRRHSKAGAGN